MKQSQPNKGNILAFAWKDCGKPQKILIQLAPSLKFEQSTFLNKSLQCYCYTSLLSHKSQIHAKHTLPMLLGSIYFQFSFFSFLSTFPSPVKHSAYISSMVRLSYSLKGIFLQDKFWETQYKIKLCEQSTINNG